MVKFQKKSSSAPRLSTASESDASEVPHTKSTKSSVTHPPQANVLEFVEDKFDNYKITNNSLPDGVAFDPDEDEVFLLQVPKSYDVEALVGVKLNLQKKTRLGDNGEFEIYPKKVKDLPEQVVTRVSSNGRHNLTNVQPVGHLVLRQSAQEVDFGADLEDFLEKFDQAENGVIHLPTDLKVRHPLLGADYKQELASRAQVLINIRKSVKKEKRTEKEEETPVKKAKKRKATKEPVEEEETQEVEAAISPEKKRRKKKDTHMETSADLQFLNKIF